MSCGLASNKPYEYIPPEIKIMSTGISLDEAIKLLIESYYSKQIK
jgi:hypothetical protein